MKISTWFALGVAAGLLVAQGTTLAEPPGQDTGQAAAQPEQAAAPVPTAPTASVPQVDGKPVVKADTKDNFEAVVAAIHQQMQPGGRWQFIDAGERRTMDASFSDMAGLYDKFGSVDKMDQPAKVRLLADQSTVNAILTRKDGDRLVCKSEIPVGSHLPIKRCKTYAQTQLERHNSQELLRQLNSKSPQLSH